MDSRIVSSQYRLLAPVQGVRQVCLNRHRKDVVLAAVVAAPQVDELVEMTRGGRCPLCGTPVVGWALFTTLTGTPELLAVSSAKLTEFMRIRSGFDGISGQDIEQYRAVLVEHFHREESGHWQP